MSCHWKVEVAALYCLVKECHSSPNKAYDTLAWHGECHPTIKEVWKPGTWGVLVGGHAIVGVHCTAGAVGDQGLCAEDNNGGLCDGVCQRQQLDHQWSKATASSPMVKGNG